MPDLRAAASLLTSAAGLALRLWSAGETSKGSTKALSLPPELEALRERAHAIAASNPGVARAMQEETLSLSIAKDLQRLVREAKADLQAAQARSEVDAEVWEDALAGMLPASTTLATLVSLAMAMDASVQLVMVPNRSAKLDTKDLMMMMHGAEKLLSQKPSAAGPA